MADDIKQDEVKACGVKLDDRKDDDYGGGMMGGAPCCVSFAELDAYELAKETAEEMSDATEQFGMLASNIMVSPDIEDKAMALQNLAKEFSARIKQPAGMQKEVKAVWDTAYVNNLPDSAFLFVESGDKDEEGKTKPRSLRHFPYKDASGKVDLPHLRNAIARIPQSNAPGLSADKKTALQERARKLLDAEQKEDESWFEKLVDKVKAYLSPKPVKRFKPFSVWENKETGQWSWLAVYSNNIRDQDNPPEIIASKSHQRFVEMVDKGVAPLPELWLWHVPEWKFGKATAIAYDDKGFAVACGVIDDNQAAKELAAWLDTREDILVSHGMPSKSIRRDENDNSIIVEHETREISPLFDFAAANKFTGFAILKEVNDMAIPKAKRDEFIENGLPANILDTLEQQTAAASKEAETIGLERKETEPAQVETSQPVTAAVTPAPAPVPAEEKPVEAETITREEVAQAIGAVVKPLMEEVKELAALVKELTKTDEVKIAEKAAMTPAASLESLIVENLFGKSTLVDGRSSLAKSKPVEAPAIPGDEWFIKNFIQ